MGWKMKTLSKNDVLVPADVPADMKNEYVKNFLAITHNSGKLMLFAGDQKIEHLNDDFYGSTKLGKIPEDCSLYREFNRTYPQKYACRSVSVA